MSSRKSSGSKIKILACAGIVAGLGGCVEYSQHSDTITSRAGDAKDWNKVVHTADPWPPYVMDNKIPGDGHRTAAVIRNYSLGPKGSGAGGDPPQDAGSSGDSGGIGIHQ